MITPHHIGWDNYQDRAERVLRPEEETLIYQGYKFLGWDIETDVTEYAFCLNNAHNYYSAFPNAWNSAVHSAADNTYWCNKCKIYWKVDMRKS